MLTAMRLYASGETLQEFYRIPASTARRMITPGSQENVITQPHGANTIDEDPVIRDPFLDVATRTGRGRGDL